MIQKTKDNRKITALSVIFLGIFMVCCARYAYNVEESVKKEVLHDMQLLLKQEAAVVADKIEQNYTLLHGISRLVAGDKETMQASLEKYLQAFSGDEFYERISVTDENANSISSDGYHFSIAGDYAFEENQQSQNNISAPKSDQLSNKTIITFSIPFTTSDSTFKAISLTKDINVLEYELLSDFYEGKGTCYIINSTGDIILRSSNEESDQKLTNIYNELADSAPDKAATLINAMKTDLNHGQNGVAEAMLNGRQHYIAYTDIGGAANAWSLVFIIDQDIIGQRSWNIMLQTVLLCSIAILSIIFMMYYITRMQNKAKRGIERLAYIDTLTQIYNLNYFYVKATILLEKNPDVPYAVVCVDIKNFKYINKTYGYEVGDHVIQDLAKTLSDNFNVRELCARISNDQFVLLYWIEEYPKLLRYYATLEEFIHQQTFGGVKIPLAFSTGIYEISDRSEKVVEMLDKAILALKSAKKQAVVQCAYYDDALLNTFIKKQEIENMMHTALSQEEFKSYLQPKYDLRTQKFTGAEALVRWISPEKGFMRPDEFIPIFEKNGFVIEVDFYILEEVCKKVRYWIDHGITPVAVSVNQSRIHIDNPMYIRRLQELMKKYEIPPHHIELELTESMFFDNHEKLIELMKSMHEMGFLISMDDFGSGYSSLNLLKKIPVDILKIDKGFLDESVSSTRSRIIIAQVVEMAHKLGILVVCEGVETEQQVDFLKEIDCDMVQGFYYAKPMPIGEFDTFRGAILPDET